MDGWMDGGETVVDFSPSLSSRFLTKFSEQRFSLSELAAAAPAFCLLPLSVLTGSGTTGGLPAPRDQVPAMVRELLSVSSQPQLPSRRPERQQAASLHRRSWADE